MKRWNACEEDAKKTNLEKNQKFLFRSTRGKDDILDVFRILQHYCFSRKDGSPVRLVYEGEKRERNKKSQVCFCWSLWGEHGDVYMSPTQPKQGQHHGHVTIDDANSIFSSRSGERVKNGRGRGVMREDRPSSRAVAVPMLCRWEKVIRKSVAHTVRL